MQMSLIDYGIDIQETDPVLVELQNRLRSHQHETSIPYLLFMQQIEERLLTTQKGIYRKRCEIRLQMYRDKIQEIRKGIAS